MVILSIIGFCLSITACLLCNRKRILCWPIFILADTIFVYLHLSRGFNVDNILLAVRESIFLLLCFEGWYRWRYKGEKHGTR